MSGPAVDPLLPSLPFDASGRPPRVPALDAPEEPGPLAPASLWRYASALPLPPGAAIVTQREGLVPLEPLSLSGLDGDVLALREDALPTGSWKDRGSTLLVSAMAAAGVREAVEDSSGNAALSLASYARRAGIELTTFVPTSATPLKKELVREAGAQLVEVPGPRSAATAAARSAAREGAFWASHAGQPLHALGAATAAFEIVERLGAPPSAVVCPLGQGGLLVGLARGFEALERAGRGKRPRLVGVQSEGCAPVARAFAAGLAGVAPVEAARGGLAEGVLVEAPSRGGEALEAVRASGGIVAAVDDLALDRALRLLWLAGAKVEPTAALPVAWALAEARRGGSPRDETLVVVLTGSGIRRGRSLAGEALP